MYDEHKNEWRLVQKVALVRKLGKWRVDGIASEQVTTDGSRLWTSDAYRSLFKYQLTNATPWLEADVALSDTASVKLIADWRRYARGRWSCWVLFWLLFEIRNPNRLWFLFLRLEAVVKTTLSRPRKTTTVWPQATSIPVSSPLRRCPSDFTKLLHAVQATAARLVF